MAVFAVFPIFVFSQNAVNSLSFSGSAYVSASMPSLFSNIAGNDFTIELWAKPSAYGTSRLFFIQKSTTEYISVLLNG